MTGAEVELNDEVFGLDPRADILHRVVTWQLEKRRGTARGTRERADVARSGKKLGRQKGGGVARHGDRRAPVFIGGGKAHGARVRDFNPSLNKKIRALGLKMALSSHAKAGTLIVLDGFQVAKTKELKGHFATLGTGARTLVIDGEAGDSFRAGSQFAGGRHASGGRRQCLRHHQGGHAGADPRRRREAGGPFPWLSSRKVRSTRVTMT